MKTFLLKNWKLLLLSLLSSISYFWFANYLDRRNFYDILICFGISFGVYFYVLNADNAQKERFCQALAIFFRLLFLLCIPPLSDDYFRFIWDGQLIANGLNPFDLLPADVAVDFPNKAELLAGMNSPNYYTVYPPIAQFIYFISAWLSPNSIIGSIVVMRSAILAAEIGIILLLPKLLKQLGINPKNSLWYTLNPLVIIEITGNLHFEGIVIFFFLLAVYFLVLHKDRLGSIPWAFAAATKLIPIFFLPILLRKLTLKKAIVFYLIFGIAFLALWLPFLNETFFSHFTESIKLYYQTFEFNASIYYLARWMGFQWVDYNLIQTVGPWLSKAAFVGVILFQLYKKPQSWPDFFKALLFAIAWYYAFALIVHPWYIITLVFLSVFTKYRFAMLWSALAVLSYWAYSNSSYQENYWLISIEYLSVLGFLIYEVFLRKQKT